MSARRFPLLLVAAILVLPLAVQPAAASAGDVDAIDGALAWLARQQNDKGFVDSVQQTNVAEAATAAGRDLRAWPSREMSAYAALQPMAGSGDTAYKYNTRVAYAVATAGYDPTDVHGHDLTAQVRARYVGSQAYVLDDAWAILALRAAGVASDDPFIQESVRELTLGRRADGGWHYATTATQSETDVTGMVLAALAAAGEDVRGDARALEFLATTHTAGGGHGARAGEGPNCQSTVWALHAYRLLDATPSEGSWHYLGSLRDVDGRFRYLADETSPRDVWCTAEVVPLLAGASFPQAVRADGTLRLPTPHALEDATLRVDGPFTRATWNFSGHIVHGMTAQLVFDTAGEHPFTLLAESGTTRWRTSGVVNVLTARPLMPLDIAEVETLRHQEVVIDAGRARDPDGTVALVEVDWRDGATSRGAPGIFDHAYTTPGVREVRVRAQDDAGAWSDASVVRVNVLNRAPTFNALPARVVADRVAPLAPSPAAAHADGDAVTLAWWFGSLSGEGAPQVTPTRLGNETLTLRAFDAHGASAWRNVTVEVVNLPPRLLNLTLPSGAVANATMALRVDAVDADGPAPRVTWRIGERSFEGTTANLSLGAGSYDVEVTARDDDDGRHTLRAPLVVAAGGSEEPTSRQQAVVPRLANVTVEAQGEALRLRFDAVPTDAIVTLHVEGLSSRVVRSGDVVLLPEGGAARGTLEARAGGLVAVAEWGPVWLEAAPLAPLMFAGAPPEVTAGEAVDLRVAPHEAHLFRFDFGDGNATDWSSSLTTRHAWTRAGTYEVRAWAREGERVVEAAHVVRVLAPPPAPVPVPASPLEAFGERSAIEATSEADGMVTIGAPAPQRDVPAPLLGWLLAALVAWLAPRRRTRAPSA